MKTNLSVYCLKYAESVLPESMVFDGGSQDKQIPICFAVYLIKTKDKKVLVDVDCDSMPRFDMRKFYSPAFVLRQAELSADQITDVIITHSHHDHIEAIGHFKKATVHITKSEYEYGRSYIPSDMRLNIFEDQHTVCPQIKIIEWGGHSIGSAIVEIKMQDTIHIFAGDECYTNTNIKEKISTGAFYNKEKSLEFIRKYSNPKYCVHTCHDISLKTERII